MHPSKVVRSQIKELTDLPNIGQAMAADLHLLGIEKPADLAGCNPYELYEKLCAITGYRHDPCVLDVFLSITRFMSGEPPQPWWAYTSARKFFLSRLRN